MFSDARAPTLIKVYIRKPGENILIISGYLVKVTEHKEEEAINYDLKITCPNGFLSSLPASASTTG